VDQDYQNEQTEEIRAILMKDIWKSISSQVSLNKVLAIVLSAYLIPLLTDWSKQQLGVELKDHGVTDTSQSG